VLAHNGKVSEAGFAAFLGEAFPLLEATAAQLDLVPSGPGGALYPHEISDEIEEVTAYLPLPSRPPHPQTMDADPSPVQVETLPTAKMAVALHEGPYDTIGETYRLLGTWVARNATPAPAPEPVREVYLVSYGEADDPADFRTEILWPLR
jgi:effector-binding domain-containing protein